MQSDWKADVILTKLAEGCTLGEAARAAGISRQAALKRRHLLRDYQSGRL